MSIQEHYLNTLSRSAISKLSSKIQSQNILGSSEERFKCTLSYGPQCEKTNLLTCAPFHDLNQPAHRRNLLSLRYLHDKTLHPWLFKLCIVHILIRLRECLIAGHVFSAWDILCQRVRQSATAKVIASIKRARHYRNTVREYLSARMRT